MRFLPAALAAVLLAAACDTTPRSLGFDPTAPPREGDYEGVVSYEAKNVPGVRYWHKARVAYLDYRNLVCEQESMKNPRTRNPDFYMPEEVIEKKKLEYLADAEANLKKVIELNPRFVMAHQVLGLVYTELKEYDKAVAAFRGVLEIDPLAGNAWVNIAHAYWRKGDAAEAKEAIAQALKINPDNRPAQQLREAIEAREREEAARKAQEEAPLFRPKPGK